MTELEIIELRKVILQEKEFEHRKEMDRLYIEIENERMALKWQELSLEEEKFRAWHRTSADYAQEAVVPADHTWI